MHFILPFPTLLAMFLVLLPTMMKECRGFTQRHPVAVLPFRIRPSIDTIETVSTSRPSMVNSSPPTISRHLPTSSSTLFERSSNDNNEPTEDFLASVDSGLLFADIMAIAIACQLMGLLDVLGDPTFWTNGGWFQSIPAAPSTLPVLIQRFSLNCVFFVVVSLSLNNAYDDNNKSAASSQQIIISSLQRSGVYAVLRIVMGALLSLMLSENPAFSMDMMQVLRECYVVALATTAARYIFYSLFSR